VIVIDLTCEQVASAERGAELRKLCARPLFTSPMGGEPVACLFDSVSRQKTYELGSWSGRLVTSRAGCGPGCSVRTCGLLVCVRSGAVPARGEFCSSAFV